MSEPVKCEGAEMKLDADDLGSFTHSLSFRVEYYRSLEYCVTWKRSMCPQRSSRRPKALKRNPQKSPTSEDEIIQRQVRGQRRRTRLRKAKAGDSVGDADEGMERDILDIISGSKDEEHVGEEDGGKAVGIADKGLDDSDDDRASVCSSTASGPSLYLATSKKPRPSQNLCSACRKLYLKAKRIKTPIKNKLLDNDPKSLTCDQWVLIKKWMPRKLPNARGKLLSHVKQISKARAKQSEQHVGESSACSRPHIFLQRNLRRCVKAKKERKRKKNRKKRPRDDSQGSRIAKQQRLHSNTPIRISCMDDEPNSRRSSCPSQEGDSQKNTDVTGAMIPSSVTLETAKPSQRAPKKTRGFRDLLAQLRSNSSVIVRETR